MKLLFLLLLAFLNVAHATYDPSLQNLQLDMMYSANVVSTTGAVTLENKDFISGNCSAANPTVCTFTSGIFTVAPNCVAAQTNAGGSTILANIASVSSSSVSVRTINSSTGADSGSIPFNLICQKQGVDYLTASNAVYSVQNQNYAATSAAYTMSWVSNATVTGTVTRYGDRAYFEGMVLLTGAPTATGLTITLPSGFVIDVAKVPGGVGNGRTSYGITKVFDSSAGTYPGQGQVRGNSSTTVNLDYWNGSAQAAITEAAPMTFATGDSVYFKFDVPIVGWTAAPFAIAAIAGYGQTPGVVGSANQAVDTFTVSYGTTNASTACTASPCSFLDQIGTAVTSITRTGTGAYTINLPRTYAKIKCVGNANVPGSNVGLFQNAPLLQCSSCSTLSFYTLNVSLAAADTNGTIICQGNY